MWFVVISVTCMSESYALSYQSMTLKSSSHLTIWLPCSSLCLHKAFKTLMNNETHFFRIVFVLALLVWLSPHYHVTPPPSCFLNSCFSDRESMSLWAILSCDSLQTLHHDAIMSLVFCCGTPPPLKSHIYSSTNEKTHAWFSHCSRWPRIKLFYTYSFQID